MALTEGQVQIIDEFVKKFLPQLYKVELRVAKYGHHYKLKITTAWNRRRLERQLHINCIDKPVKKLKI